MSLLQQQRGRVPALCLLRAKFSVIALCQILQDGAADPPLQPLAPARSGPGRGQSGIVRFDPQVGLAAVGAQEDAFILTAGAGLGRIVQKIAESTDQVRIGNGDALRQGQPELQLDAGIGQLPLPVGRELE